MNSYFTDLMTNTDKLIDILDEKNEILDKPDAEELYQCRGEVEFENGKSSNHQSISHWSTSMPLTTASLQSPSPTRPWVRQRRSPSRLCSTSPSK